MTKHVAPAQSSASIRQRLLDRARLRDENFQLLLDGYAVERLLYRLSIAAERDQFLLKGAMLFALWFEVPHRPTRDADLLGSGPPDAQSLVALVRRLCAVQVDDAIRFDDDSITLTPIREEARYHGLRISLKAYLGTARCSVQWDVGFGDAVTPEPLEAVCPTLLPNMPAPRLRVYPRETVFAEKFEAMVILGMLNSRMKDYFDLLALARENAMDATVLGQAISATFKRRQTPLPKGLPIGLSDAFANDATKQIQWKAFLGKNRLLAPPLADVVAELAAFSQTALERARTLEPYSNSISRSTPSSI